MKTGVIICLSVAVVWSCLALLQLWFNVVSAEVFIKLSITAGVIGIIVLLVTLAIREYLVDKDLKSKGFIDE